MSISIESCIKTLLALRLPRLHYLASARIGHRSSLDVSYLRFLSTSFHQRLNSPMRKPFAAIRPFEGPGLRTEHHRTAQRTQLVRQWTVSMAVPPTRRPKWRPLFRPISRTGHVRVVFLGGQERSDSSSPTSASTCRRVKTLLGDAEPRQACNRALSSRHMPLQGDRLLPADQHQDRSRP